MTPLIGHTVFFFLTPLPINMADQLSDSANWLAMYLGKKALVPEADPISSVCTNVRNMNGGFFSRDL